MRSSKWFYLLMALVVLSICVSNYSCIGEAPKFARWELDSLKEISPMTPVAYDSAEGTYLARKWSLTVYVGGYTTKEYADGCSISSPNQSKIDEKQYIDFKEDGSFELSITDSACVELKKQIKELLGEEYSKPGNYYGTYKCYDSRWCGCTCDGAYGVVLFDKEGEILNRFIFVYLSAEVTQEEEEFSLDHVYMKNPYRDDISSDISLYLHKQ